MPSSVPGASRVMRAQAAALPLRQAIVRFDPDNVLIAPEEAQAEVKRQMARERQPVEGRRTHYDLVWEAALRKASRQAPGYDA